MIGKLKRRLVYYLSGKTIWLLTIGKHKEAYEKYLKRLHALRSKLKQQSS